MSPNAPLGAAMIHAALLMLMAVVLALVVINARRGAKVGLGDGGNKALAKAIRVHANFTEYAPLAIASYILLALGGISAWFIHALGAAFLVGRVAHATGLMQHEGASLGRFIGTAVSCTVLIVAAIRLLISALG
ncbi:MAG: MAPEG family protein [Hyphomicrobiales bacterium]